MFCIRANKPGSVCATQANPFSGLARAAVVLPLLAHYRACRLIWSAKCLPALRWIPTCTVWLIMLSANWQICFESYWSSVAPKMRKALRIAVAILSNHSAARARAKAVTHEE
jgi:hypothetical protein